MTTGGVTTPHVNAFIHVLKRAWLLLKKEKTHHHCHSVIHYNNKSYYKLNTYYVPGFAQALYMHYFIYSSQLLYDFKRHCVPQIRN